MTYRRATRADVAKLTELGVLSWSQFKNELSESHWSSLLSSVASPSTYLSLMSSGIGFVGEVDNDIVGMSFFIPSGSTHDIYDPSWCQLRFVSVHPLHRGKGIARHLVQMCLDEATRANERTMALHTSERMSTARHIYERLGFTVVRELEQRYGMRYWLYTLELHKPE